MHKYTGFFLGLILLIGGFVRFYNFTVIPPELYIDEVSIGLNAYDVLSTGHDQYGARYPLIFTSLGDYKVPGYIYLVAGSMAVFGKNEFAIRFPSAFFGTLTLLIVFLVVEKALRFSQQTLQQKNSIALLSAGILAITPWHIHFSRGGFEVVVALFFYLLGLYCALLFWQKKRLWYVLLICICFLISFYTYDAYRVIVPLSGVIGFFLGIHDKEKRGKILLGATVLAVLSWPLISFSLTSQGQARFFQTSAFVENPYTSGIVKIFADVAIFLRNYFSYFSITYLFRFGDQINRHQVNDLGILYLWQIPFIFAGLYFLLQTKNTTVRLLIGLTLFLGAIPASLARPSPHTLRFLIGSVSYAILTGCGIYQLFSFKQKWSRIVLFVIGCFAIIEIGYYFNYYYVNYPKEALIDWGGACKATALAMQQQSTNYKHIVVDKNIGCIKEYFLFYVPSIAPLYVDPSWNKPLLWKNEKVLYVRPFYGKDHPDGLVENITLVNINHDIFAQFIQL